MLSTKKGGGSKKEVELTGWGGGMGQIIWSIKKNKGGLRKGKKDKWERTRAKALQKVFMPYHTEREKLGKWGSESFQILQSSFMTSFQSRV